MFGTIVATALVATAPLGHHRPTVKHHLRGCNTRACDVHIEGWLRRLRERNAPWATALASYYSDAGSTASGAHYTLGFAHLGPGEGAYAGMAFGTRVRFCNGPRCATGTMDDHGPYVGGREFDLNEALRDALGCGGLCAVRWRIVH